MEKKIKVQIQANGHAYKPIQLILMDSEDKSVSVSMKITEGNDLVKSLQNAIFAINKMQSIMASLSDIKMYASDIETYASDILESVAVENEVITFDEEKISDIQSCIRDLETTVDELEGRS